MTFVTISMYALFVLVYLLAVVCLILIYISTSIYLCVDISWVWFRLAHSVKILSYQRRSNTLHQQMPEDYLASNNFTVVCKPAT